MEKARDLAADAIIFDLEDAVSPEEKPKARALLAEVLRRDDFGARARIVRVNGLDTPWGADDLAAFADHPGVDAVLVPKVNSAADLDAVAARVKAPLWAMMETAKGCLNAAAIAAHPRLQGMVMGTNDLAKELGSAVPRRPVCRCMAGWALCGSGGEGRGQGDRRWRLQCLQGRGGPACRMRTGPRHGL
jgi:(3S)-malyl-CoA thioesterase